MSHSDDQIRARLLARKAELAASILQSKDARSTVELDQTRNGRLTRMDAMQQQAMEEATARRRIGEQRAIDAALIRLDDGDYGYCSLCGDDIAPARLDHDPAVATCLNCAAGKG
ncbi:MAG: TraR/DksA C4-type zinc finger protein [Alphaproteobacteria bacterium]